MSVTRKGQSWMKSMKLLPDAPCLPLTHDSERIKQKRVSHRRVDIQVEDWSRFKATADRHGVAPLLALVTCFGTVMARWCNQPRLLLGMRLSQQRLLFSTGSDTVTDSTNILPLDVVGEGEDFFALTKLNQQSLDLAYKHRYGSEVDSLRGLQKTPDAYPYGRHHLSCLARRGHT